MAGCTGCQQRRKEAMAGGLATRGVGASRRRIQPGGGEQAATAQNGGDGKNRRRLCFCQREEGEGDPGVVL